MPSCGTGTQCSDLPHSWRNDSAPDSEEISERLTDFWFSLPRTKTLRAQGISRLNQRKSDSFIAKTLTDLVGITVKAEDEEAEKVKRLDEFRTRKSSLDRSRYTVEPSFTKEMLEEDVGDYWKSMSKSWASERLALETDLAKQIERRAIKPRSPKVIEKKSVLATDMETAAATATARIPRRRTSLADSDFQKRMSNHLENIREEALRKTITAERRKEIRKEIDDMDLCSRPTHFLKMPMKDRMDPLEGTESVGEIYSNVKKMISEESLDRLMHSNPEPMLTLQGKFKYRRGDKNPHTAHNLFRTPMDRVSYTTGRSSAGDSEIQKSESDLTTEFEDYKQDSLADSAFGSSCLRELVNFQEGDGWDVEEFVDFPSSISVSDDLKL